MTFTRQTTPCPACNEGRTYRPIRFVGEAYGEWAEAEPCDLCEGTGEIEAVCAHCENDAPLDAEGFCACCAEIPDELALTEIRHTGHGSIAA